jgi:hypothetical protein
MATVRTLTGRRDLAEVLAGAVYPVIFLDAVPAKIRDGKVANLAWRTALSSSPGGAASATVTGRCAADRRDGRYRFVGEEVQHDRVDQRWLLLHEEVRGTGNDGEFGVG